MWGLGRRAAGRLPCGLLLLGARAESTAVAGTVSAAESALTEVLGELGSVRDPLQIRQLEEAISMPVEVSKGVEEVSPSERARQLALLRLHNSSYNLHGQIIRAKVLDMDRKKIVIDTGIKIAKIAHSDISAECIIGTTVQDDTPRRPGEVRVGDIVQVFLESMETPEGEMMVSGQQAAQERRFHAIWKELEERMETKTIVQGRILNQLHGGYAVGVAGLVCFLPAQACHRATAARIGKLQDFYVVAMNKGRQNVTLRDAMLEKLMSQQVQPAAGREGARPPPAGLARLGKPRGQQNPEEVNQAVNELRELLGSAPAKPAASS